mgnify:CR=1 FL=1
MAKTEPKSSDLQQSIEIPKKIPLLPIRDIVVFPYMVLPLFVGREMSIKAIETALEGNRMIYLSSQKDINVENPSPSDLYSMVTVGVIMLTVMLVRIMKGHFDADHQFGFEAASWYWHFVDVVWLGLFIFVYVL